METHANTVAPMVTALAVWLGSALCAMFGALLALFGFLYQAGRVIARAQALEKEHGKRR